MSKKTCHLFHPFLLFLYQYISSIAFDATSVERDQTRGVRKKVKHDGALVGAWRLTRRVQLPC